ncbi:hypothetical protein Dimus_027982 [Dionaea muscipula]
MSARTLRKWSTAMEMVMSCLCRRAEQRRRQREMGRLGRPDFGGTCSPCWVCSNDSSFWKVISAAAMDLIDAMKVEVLLSDMTLQEAELISEINNNLTQLVPLLLLTPTAIAPPLVPLPSSNVIQISNDISVHIQCIAAIVGYFKWRRVTAIYEQANAFALNYGIITLLSDALQPLDATINQHVAFPPMTTPAGNSELILDKELSKLKGNTNRVFVLVQCSLQLAIHIFHKANRMGMMTKGYAWIVSDEVASLLDSLNSSVIASMQGVIGYKTYFDETSTSYLKFSIKFQQSYGSLFPQEGTTTCANPSIFALRAYDATWATAEALANRQGDGDVTSKVVLLQNVLSSNFSGLSGNIGFKNGELAQSPTFQIINVIGKSYNQVAFWSLDIGFSRSFPGQDYATERGKRTSKNETVEIGPIYWPGGQVTVPPGWEFVTEEPLRIGVPATGAFHQFVNVSHDETQNKTVVSGFSIEVFEAALKYLPYPLPYKFIPFYGDYDQMVQQIDLKLQGLDGAVGDTNILAERCQWAGFTQPYVKSGIALVVTTIPDYTKETWMFMEVFQTKMWLLIPSFSLFIGFVVWLIENGDNPDFGTGSFSQQVGTTIWFSFTVLFFVQREALKSNLSRVVLAPWVFLVLMLTANFTAVLTSKMTVSQLVPSAKDIEVLRRENAVIGCNRRSFTCRFLVNVLHIKPENVRQIASIDDYPEAFEKGIIKGAIFVTEHANVFLAKYCHGYTITGPTFTFGGLGFAFPKDSALVGGMSVAILEAIESGEVEELEREMLSSFNCSASAAVNSDTQSLGPRPFSGLFYISGAIALMALMVTAFPLVENHCRNSILVWKAAIIARTCLWVLSLRLQSSRKSRLEPATESLPPEPNNKPDAAATPTGTATE